MVPSKVKSEYNVVLPEHEEQDNFKIIIIIYF